LVFNSASIAASLALIGMVLPLWAAGSRPARIQRRAQDQDPWAEQDHSRNRDDFEYAHHCSLDFLEPKIFLTSQMRRAALILTP
jgi:hypothetical protein